MSALSELPGSRSSELEVVFRGSRRIGSLRLGFWVGKEGGADPGLRARSSPTLRHGVLEQGQRPPPTLQHDEPIKLTSIHCEDRTPLNHLPASACCAAAVALFLRMTCILLRHARQAGADGRSASFLVWYRLPLFG